jgi:hypothetical protein
VSVNDPKRTFRLHVSGNAMHPRRCLRPVPGSRHRCNGLSVVAEVAGETAARKIQLGIEYDPAPPFDSGHPDKAPTLKSELLSARYDGFISTYRKRIEQAAPF